jgi:uncharacterized protein YjbJ (UPF0337 family)
VRELARLLAEGRLAVAVVVRPPTARAVPVPGGHPNTGASGSPDPPDRKETTVGGAGDKIKGKANEMTGKATGDKSQEVKGKGQQAKGEVKDRTSGDRDDE